MNKADQKTEAFEQVRDTVDRVTDPKRLSREDYKELLEELIEDLQSRLECAEEEDAE